MTSLRLGGESILKAAVPAFGCLCGLLYCCWILHCSRNSYFPPDASYKVEVTVTTSDGTVIKPVARAPR